MSTPAQARARNLRTVAVLAGLFLLPLLASFWMYYGGHWQPSARTNHGELIEPARPLALASLAHGSETFLGKWSLVYIGDGACNTECATALIVMRQTRLSLNNDMARVQRVFLASGNCCDRERLAREYPGLIVLEAAQTPLLGEFPPTDRARALFIVDPLGNLVLRYDTRANPKGIREDLMKLLRLSHIG